MIQYRIKKVLNSSVVLVCDTNNQEYVLLGKGIGYGKKYGEFVEKTDSDQMFVPVENSKSSQFLQLMDEIPLEILQVTQEIILQANTVLNCELHKNLYLVLADHLNFAIQRLKDGMKITNRVFWEIKNYYPEEFRVGTLALGLIEQRLGILLDENEAANIAFHIANAKAKDEQGYDSAKYAKVIGEINNIALFSINKQIDRNSIHYKRFITHIKFFVERYFTDKMLSDSDISLALNLDLKYPNEWMIVLKIRNYLETKYEKPLPKEELIYLLVHIIRMIKEK